MKRASPAAFVLASIVALCPLREATAVQRAPDHPQEVFARRALGSLGEADDLASAIGEAPFRATQLVYDLLHQVAREGGNDWARSSARRIARCVRDETGRGHLMDAVDRFDAERWRELEHGVRGANQAASAGSWVIALDRAAVALELARSLGDPVLEAECRCLLARIRIDLGELEPALAELRRCIEIDTELDLPDALARDLALSGDAAFRLGRYAPALSAFERSRAASVRTGEDTNVRDADLGALYSNLGRYQEARDTLRRALSAARAESDARTEAYVLEVQGALAGSRGHYVEALRLLQRAIEVGASTPAEGTARTRYAGLLSELGRTADAEDALAVSLERLEAGSLPHAFALLTLGVVRIDGGRAEQALATLAAARVELARLGHEDGLAEARAQQARAFARLMRHGEAETLLRELALELEERQDTFSLSLCLTQLGETLEARSAFDEAQAAYTNALGHAARIGVAESAWRARAGIGRVLEATGRETEALRAYEAALAEVEAVRTWLGAPLLRQRYLSDKLELYRRAARIHARAGRLDLAFQRSEGARARTLLELQGARPEPEHRAGGSASFRALSEAESELLMVELRVTEALRGGCDETTRRELLERRERARARHSAARVAAALSAPHAAQVGGLSEPVALDDVRRRLPEDVALLEYIVGEEGVAVFLVSPGGVRFVELDTSAEELVQLVERIHAPFADLRAGRTDTANLTFDVRAAQALYGVLLEPLADELATCGTLWIVPDGPLWRLPFGLLVTSFEKRPVDPNVLYSQYTGCRFLIEDVALVHLPSAGLIVAGSDALERKGPALGLAWPVPLPEGALPLDSALRETRALEALVDADSIVRLEREQATEAAFKAAAPAARQLHLAVHGALDDRRPAFSRLALAPSSGEDGWLHAYEIAALDLGGARAVLSACETAGTPIQGEGLLGLARAFLVAGCRSVVATQWRVDDEATGFLMEHYYEELRAGEEPARALRLAQLATLAEERDGVRLVHPFFWAACTHIGLP